MNDLLPVRLRYAVARFGPPLVALLVVAGLLGGIWGVQAATAPPVTTQVTDRTNSQTFTTEVNTSATVTGQTVLYERGQTLRNRPVYLLSASPEMVLTVRTSVPRGQSVQVRHRVTLELVGTRGNEVFWRSSRVLTDNASEVSDGDHVTRTRLNISRLEESTLAPIRSAVGRIGSLETRFAVESSYRGRDYVGQLNATAPLTVGGGSYAVDRPDPASRTHTEAVTRTVTSPANPSPPAAVRGGFAALALLAAVGVWRLYTESENIETLRRERRRARFSDWISRAHVPNYGDKTTVRVGSLGDLVDIAIDSNKRVIYDEDRSEYAVIDGDIHYQYWEGDDSPLGPSSDFKWSDQESRKPESARTGGHDRWTGWLPESLLERVRRGRHREETRDGGENADRGDETDTETER